jgi:hypothetical protein
MSFHDVPQEVAEERIERMRREAEAYRLASEARRGRRSRARRRWSLRRQAVALRLCDLAHSANELIGEIISPAWPAGDQPRRYIRPTR